LRALRPQGYLMIVESLLYNVQVVVLGLGSVGVGSSLELRIDLGRNYPVHGGQNPAKGGYN
jgi:hypothetical protein